MRSKTYFFSRERFALRMSSLSSLGSRRTTSCKVWKNGDICDGVWRGCDGVGGEGMHLRFCPQCVQPALPQCCILLCSWDAHATQPVSKTSDDCCSDRCNHTANYILRQHHSPEGVDAASSSCFTVDRRRQDLRMAPGRKEIVSYNKTGHEPASTCISDI